MFRWRTASDGQRRFGDRRRASRLSAGWPSTYRILDEERDYSFDDDFDACELRDLSMDGAGIRLVEGTLAIGDQVELDLRLGARQRASIKLRGRVRHTSADDDGTPRAGLEFLEIGQLERALLHRLVRELRVAAPRSA